MWVQFKIGPNYLPSCCGIYPIHCFRTEDDKMFNSNFHNRPEHWKRLTTQADKLVVYKRSLDETLWCKAEDFDEAIRYAINNYFYDRRFTYHPEDISEFSRDVNGLTFIANVSKENDGFFHDYFERHWRLVNEFVNMKTENTIRTFMLTLSVNEMLNES